MADHETKLAGPAFPPEVLEEMPHLGLYDYTPATDPWPEIPGLVQMRLATFVEGKGWLVTRRSVIYGGRHGRPPLIADDLDTIVGIMVHELRTGLRAMKARLARG